MKIIKKERKVWITKFALTKGVYELEAQSESEDGDFVFGKAWNDSFRGKGREWCETKEEAIKRAEEMRDKRIRSLENQIEKLKAMKF